MAREATEEIISIAFAPAGKTLDAAEKKRVVEKFLGAGNDTRRDSVLDASVRNSITPSSTSAVEPSNAPTQKPPAPPSAASAQRPATPPTTPQPIITASGTPALANSASTTAATTTNTTSSSFHRTSSGQFNQSIIQESLKRLNLAASHVNNVAEAASMVANQRTGSVTSEKSAPRASQTDEASVVQADNDASSTTSSRHQRPSLNKYRSADLDLVIGIHDFLARTERELSFKKVSYYSREIS